MTVDRTHLPRPPESAAPPLTPPDGIRPDHVRPEAVEELLRAWAEEEAATPPGGSLRQRPPDPPRVRPRKLIAAVLLVLALLGVALTIGYLVTDSISDNVKRVPDVFGGIDPSTRPPADKSLTFLLVGTDSRSSDATAAPDPGPDGPRRGDVLMIARLNADRTVAGVASIPRDAVVDIPGHGRGRIDDADAIGGPALLIRTVEDLAGIRVDHLAEIDFGGFRAIVDAVGGIDVGVDAETGADGVVVHRDVRHLDGRAASAYLRQRPGYGDADRSAREQNALRALITRIADQGTLSSPAGTYRLLEAASRSVSVDDTLSNGGLRSLVSTLHGLAPKDITFVRAPVSPPGADEDPSVVRLDPARSAELWTSLQTDSVVRYADAHPTDTLGPVTR